MIKTHRSGNKTNQRKCRTTTKLSLFRFQLSFFLLAIVILHIFILNDKIALENMHLMISVFFFALLKNYYMLYLCVLEYSFIWCNAIHSAALLCSFLS